MQTILDQNYINGIQSIKDVFEKGNKMTIDTLKLYTKALNDARKLDYFVEEARKISPLNEIKEWATSSVYEQTLNKLCLFSEFP